MNNLVLKCENIYKTFGDDENTTEVLKGISFDIKEGEMVAIVGQSGSGKSTLLHILGGLDDATEGDVYLNNVSWSSMKSSQKDEWRNQNLGVIYQQHYLLNEFTTLENVAMPLIVRGLSFDKAKKEAKEMLEKVGMGHRMDFNPAALSGGERQRVSIARALVTNPKCIIADEPTGNLDSKNAKAVFSLLQEIAKEKNAAVILVTHDEHLANQMSRKITIEDGVAK